MARSACACCDCSPATATAAGPADRRPGSGRVQVSRTFGVEFELFQGEVPAREGVRSR